MHAETQSTDGLSIAARKAQDLISLRDGLNSASPAGPFVGRPMGSDPEDRCSFADNDMHSGDRVALVIGNGDYEHVPDLSNPSSDAEAIKVLLEGMGFSVISGTDLDRAGFEAKVREFARASRNSDVALFFYAGHAIQVGGENYLIPVDAKVDDETAIDFELLKLQSVTGFLGEGSKVGVVLLDACRDNPFVESLSRAVGKVRSSSVLQGLAPISSDAGGLLVAYATAPGDVASDGYGNHSPFTAALLRHLGSPGLELEIALKRVKADVATLTNQEQRPWTNSNLTTEVYLVPAQ